MHIGHVNPPGIRSHDSGYGISPTNTGHVVGPSGEHFTAISQKAMTIFTPLIIKFLENSVAARSI